MAEQASPGSNAPGAPANEGPAASPKKSNADDSPLLRSIKVAVNLTNSTLATFEQVTDESTAMIASRLQQLGRQARHIATRAASTYDNRGQYGPQIVAGSAVVAAGAIALRTRRLPAAVIGGGVGGAAAYGNVYGYEDRSATSWRNGVPK